MIKLILVLILISGPLFPDTTYEGIKIVGSDSFCQKAVSAFLSYKYIDRIYETDFYSMFDSSTLVKIEGVSRKFMYKITGHNYVGISSRRITNNKTNHILYVSSDYNDLQDVDCTLIHEAAHMFYDTYRPDVRDTETFAKKVESNYLNKMLSLLYLPEETGEILPEE